MPLGYSQILPACGLTGNHTNTNCIIAGPHLYRPLQNTAFPFLWDSFWVSSSCPAWCSVTSTSLLFQLSLSSRVSCLQWDPFTWWQLLSAQRELNAVPSGFHHHLSLPRCCPTHSGCIEPQDIRASWHRCPSSLCRAVLCNLDSEAEFLGLQVSWTSSVQVSWFLPADPLSEGQTWTLVWARLPTGHQLIFCGLFSPSLSHIPVHTLASLFSFH